MYIYISVNFRITGNLAVCSRENLEIWAGFWNEENNHKSNSVYCYGLIVTWNILNKIGRDHFRPSKHNIQNKQKKEFLRMSHFCIEISKWKCTFWGFLVAQCSGAWERFLPRGGPSNTKNEIFPILKNFTL